MGGILFTWFCRAFHLVLHAVLHVVFTRFCTRFCMYGVRRAALNIAGSVPCLLFGVACELRRALHVRGVIAGRSMLRSFDVAQ